MRKLLSKKIQKSKKYVSKDSNRGAGAEFRNAAYVNESKD
jgi:hypothetical protein